MRARLEVVGVGDLDLNGDVSLQTTYAIADIANPDKRKAAFSKSILLPGTKNNNNIFGQIFEVDIYSDFNPNLKTDIILYVDDLENLRGVLRLVDIMRIDGKITYNVTIIGGVGNIYSTLGDSFLTDLDLSAYDHELDKATIITSWTATIGEGYVYPMIDYGRNNGVTWRIEDFAPSIYLKEYIDKIFESAGFTYTSDFFDSDRFKRLIVPYAGGTMRASEATIDLNEVDVQNNAAQTIAPNGSTYIHFQTENKDDNDLWSLFFMTPKVSGDYKFNITFWVDLSINNFWSSDINLIYIPPGSTTRQTIWSYATKGAGTYQDALYGNTRLKVDISPQPFLIKQGGTVIFELVNQNATSNNYIMSGTSGGYNVNATFTAKIFNADTYENETVIIGDTIPQKIKQKDLLQDVIRMFNLYVEPERDKPSNLLIEPRDDFYAAGDSIDWTEKHDTSKALQIKPMGDINANRYIYKYSPGKDYYNKFYTENYRETYGTRTIETINDFVKGVKDTTVKFSPTPLSSDPTNGRIISTISQSHISNQIDTHPVSNIRLLYWGGTLAQGRAWNMLEGNGTSTAYTIYPYAGHLDNPYSPTFDLSFGAPKDVYYDTDVYTNGNLFTVYHKNHLEDLIDSNSKIVTGYFYLTPLDIRNLSFKHEYKVGLHLLRLLKVSNFDSVIKGVTKCEFLRVRNKPGYTDTSTTSNGGYLTVLDGTALYQTPTITR